MRNEPADAAAAGAGDGPAARVVVTLVTLAVDSPIVVTMVELSAAGVMAAARVVTAETLPGWSGRVYVTVVLDAVSRCRPVALVVALECGSRQRRE